MSHKSSEKVSQLAPAEIQQLTFGVRYEPQFKLLDRIGSVIDEILQAEGSPFDPARFPLSDSNIYQYRLLSELGDSYLLINQQDIVLQLPLKTRTDGQIDSWASDFQEYALGPLRKIGGVRSILRYGVMFRFKEEDAASLENPPVKRYLSPEFSTVNSLAMHFSRRLAMDEALLKKRVNDFRSAIYTVGQTESGRVQVSIDYQHYFQPALDAGEWDDRPFPEFVRHGTSYVNDEFQKWFRRFMAVSEVA
jgi:hypothetical protein